MLERLLAQGYFPRELPPPVHDTRIWLRGRGELGRVAPEFLWWPTTDRIMSSQYYLVVSRILLMADYRELWVAAVKRLFQK